MSKREAHGMKKHAKGGRGGPSPRTKLRRQLEENRRRKKPTAKVDCESVKDLFQ